MKRKRNSYFSLLEVLVALMLITIALPLLMTPFFYATADQVEAIKKMKQEKAVAFLVTSILGDLQTGAIPLNSLEQESLYPLKEEWKIPGTYRFKKLSRHYEDEDNEGKPELWLLLIALSEEGKNAGYPYEFIVKKNKPAAPLEKEEPKP